MNNKDPLYFLYSTDNVKGIFGDVCVLEDEYFEHGREYLVAVFLPNHDEGQKVEVYCTSCSADFYRIVVHESKDRCHKGYELSTGSGMAQFANTIGLSASDGMLNLK